MDYDRLLDDEMKAFIEETNAFYPPDATDMTVAEQRALYDKMCAHFDAGRPEGINVVDQVFANVPCRIYEPTDPHVTIIYFHGGGFIVGGLDSHDSICAEIADQTGQRVVSVAYRLSPEHPFPADFYDALEAFESITEAHPGAIILAGDSAGGNLAAAVAQYTRERTDAVIGMLLIYPGLGGDGPSYQKHANAPGLSADDVAYYTHMRAGGRTPPKTDPRFSPLRDHTFRDLPPTVVFTAALDPLSHDGTLYVQKITDAGGMALCMCETGLIHGYLRARHRSKRAAASFSRIIRSLRSFATREEKFGSITAEETASMAD